MSAEALSFALYLLQLTFLMLQLLEWGLDIVEFYILNKSQLILPFYIADY